MCGIINLYMDYTQAAKRYNLDKFIEQLEGLKLFEIQIKIEKEISLVENSKTSSHPQYKQDVESLKKSYLSNLLGLSSLLEQGPIGVNDVILEKFKTLLEDLVERKELKKGILNVI